MRRDDGTWFKARTYGWGWGPAQTWQGWVVYALHLGLGLGGAVVMLPEHPVGFIVWLVVLTALLFGVCIWKGARPKWRWGSR